MNMNMNMNEYMIMMKKAEMRFLGGHELMRI